MMDQREKMYNKASRENKKSVDIVNRKLFAKRKQAEQKVQKLKIDYDQNNTEEPFYIRLIKKDNQYQSQKR